MQHWSAIFHTREEFSEWSAQSGELLAFRRSLERALADRLQEAEEHASIYFGYCVACNRHEHFLYDLQFSDGINVNWRERLVCKRCGLSNRQRVAFGLASPFLLDPHRTVYLTEAHSILAGRMRALDEALTTSEFLLPAVSPGSFDENGTRCEDLRHLTFSDATFDCVLCYDVLEHIYDFRSALREIWRILKHGGAAYISVPFAISSTSNIVRAELNQSGEVRHLLEPEFHGDPIDPEKGILCFYHFGWELLADMRSVGFFDVSLHLIWSSDFANIGEEQIIVCARKS